MELIKEIHDEDLGIKPIVKGDIRYRLRRAARALIFKGDKIAVLNVKALFLHQLPGGGVEDNESIDEGLMREVMEETGCIINQIQELGVVIEYRKEFELIQVSYVFIGNVQDGSGQPVFTAEEIGEGCVLEWMTVDEAFALMKNQDKPSTYACRFRSARDAAILEYYLNKK